MLINVRLGVICIVIGSLLMFLVFFVYVFDKERFVHICFITTKLEYDVIPPDKGKGKAVPDKTAQGGSGHDPPRERERTSCLSRRNESDDHSQSHLTCRRPTRKSDNEDTWDGLASEVKKVAETLAKALRKTQASLSSLDQHISALRKKNQG